MRLTFNSFNVLWYVYVFTFIYQCLHFNVTVGPFFVFRIKNIFICRNLVAAQYSLSLSHSACISVSSSLIILMDFSTSTYMDHPPLDSVFHLLLCSCVVFIDCTFRPSISLHLVNYVGSCLFRSCKVNSSCSGCVMRLTETNGAKKWIRNSIKFIYKQ